MYSEDDIGLLLKRIHESIRQRADRSLKQDGLTMAQARILFCLGSRQERKTAPRDLEEIFRVSQPTMAGILKRLERKGFLITSTDPDDRRSKNILPTPKAKAFFRRMYLHRTRFDQTLVQGFTEEEVLQFRHLLIRVLRNLDDIPSP